MKTLQESVCLRSLGDKLAGTLFLPESGRPAPALIICHGAGEFKENYFELCALLASRDIAALAIDMHGHGQSAGERHHVKMRQWVPDIRAAIDFLLTRPEIDGKQVGAFGLSSGGTAILEAAMIEPRLKALVVLDVTVRNSLPWHKTLGLKLLLMLGYIKKWLTKRDLRVPLAKLMHGFKMAADPDVQRQLHCDPRLLDAYMAFPFPGAVEAFFVDTLERVSKISTPTLILWGAEDSIDPPETGRMLYDALSCKKQLHIIPGNGHVGHLDRNKDQVFALTADWFLKILHDDSDVRNVQTINMTPKTIEGEAADSISREEKWALLSSFLTQHGREALSYATLQAGLEYFITDYGFIAYTTVRHPVFARQSKKIAFSDPVCAPEFYTRIIREFVALNPRAVFGCVSEPCAAVLRDLGFKVNCIGYEAELPIQTYNTKGNWKELDMIKRARNEAKREGIAIREEEIERVNRDELLALSSRWIGTKKVNDREIWIYARRPVFKRENDVRKFVAYDREGHVAGFAFYDPMYRNGQVFGYSANILRCDESRFGKLATALHMEAMEKFKPEGREVLNLNLSPFVKLDQGKFNDDFGSKLFFKLSAQYGNAIYNFQGLAFHKSKYRGNEKYLYFASNGAWPSNDIYLAFLSADITRSYFLTLGRLLWGMLTARRNGAPQ